MMLQGLATSAEGLQSNLRDGPPPGPSDQARCPVTGKTMTITDSTVALDFANGQKLYFASEAMAGEYRKNPRAFMLSPLEMPLAMPDGARGLPDLRGTQLYCPYTNETIDVSMQSIRVDHRYGQAVYFCCNGCLTRFWTEPQTAFATSDSLLLVEPDTVHTRKEGWLMQPPPGPSDQAKCPVTGKSLTITESTASLGFANGQKLYFVSEEAAQAYRTTPRAFILSPFELPLAMPDGGRGLPDLRDSTLYCPYSNETIDVSMQSIRVTHRHGQAVYFCCHGCLTRFWSDPATSFADAVTVLV